MTNFWAFLAKLPFAFMALLLTTALLVFLTANPDIQMQLAAAMGE